MNGTRNHQLFGPSATIAALQKRESAFNSLASRCMHGGACQARSSKFVRFWSVRSGKFWYGSYLRFWDFGWNGKIGTVRKILDRFIRFW